MRPDAPRFRPRGHPNCRCHAMLHRPRPCVSKPAISRSRGHIRASRRKVPSIPRAYGVACGRRGSSRNVYKNEGTGVAGEGGIVSGMAGRYATALFELALETKAVDQVQSDLKAFDALIASSPDLRAWCARRCSRPRSRPRRCRRCSTRPASRAWRRISCAWSPRTGACSRSREMIRGFNALVATAQGRGDRAGHRRGAAQ